MRELTDVQFQAISAIFREMSSSIHLCNGRYAAFLAERRLFSYRTGTLKVTVLYHAQNETVLVCKDLIINSTLKTILTPKGRVFSQTWEDETIRLEVDEQEFQRTVPDEWYGPLLEWLDCHQRRERYLKASTELEQLMNPKPQD